MSKNLKIVDPEAGYLARPDQLPTNPTATPTRSNDAGSLHEAAERLIAKDEKVGLTPPVGDDVPELPSSLDREITIATSDDDIPRTKFYRNRTLTLREFLVANLLVGRSGPKGGRHYIQGALAADGPRRGVASFEMMVFDVENGQPSAEVREVCERHGILVIIHPTASNMKSSTSVKSDDVHKHFVLGPDDEAAGEQVIEYLLSKRTWRPEIGKSFVFAGYKEHAYHVEHKAYERFRVIVPFAEVVRFVDMAKTNNGSRDVWKAAYRATAKKLGIEQHDTSCEDLERAIYTFRGPDLGGQKAWFCGDRLVTFEELRGLVDKTETAYQVAKPRSRNTNGNRSPRGRNQTARCAPTSLTRPSPSPEPRDDIQEMVRKRLAAEHVRRSFEFGRFCLEYSPNLVEKIDNDGSVKVSGPCPFGHTDASGDEFMAKDATEASQTDYHPVGKCHHPDCKGKTVVDFTAQILRIAGEYIQALEPFIEFSKEDAKELDRAIEKYNGMYAVARQGSNVLIAVKPHSATEPWTFTKPESLRLFHKTERVTMSMGSSKRQVEAFKEWEKHPLRLTFNDVVFRPVGVGETDSTLPDVLNMWQGFSIMPIEGDWSLLRKHIFEVICQNDGYLFAWVMCWLANLVQRPSRKTGTSIVARGRKGTGKTIVAKWIRALCPSNSLSLSKRDHLLGRFNAHLAQVVFVVCEESFWAGDKAAEGVIKDLITGDTIAIEAKGKDLFEVDNHIHLWQCSNEDWAVPATLDERRFLVLDVSDSHREDFAYFGAIDGQMKNGGLAAMLFDLAALPIPDWIELRKPPVTAALREQMEHGLKSHEAWVRRSLEIGAFDNDPKRWAAKLDDGDRVAAETVYESYTHYAETHHDRYPAKSATIGKLLKRIGIERVREGKDNRSVYVFPPLDDMRRKAVALKLYEADESEDTDCRASQEQLQRWAEYGKGADRP